MKMRIASPKMAQTMILLKLGGSILTKKHDQTPVVRSRHVLRLARTLVAFRRRASATPLVLLHGAGSFGHPLAHRYRLVDRSLTRERIVGMGATVTSVRVLGTALAQILQRAGLPVVPLQTSAMTVMRNGRLLLHSLDILSVILRHGGIPLFGGDVVLADGSTTHIASADDLSVALARQYPRARLIFASDVDGVYATFPPQRGDRPLTRMDRQMLRAVLRRHTVLHTPRDVTGGMLGKLAALLSLRRRTVVVCNGNKPNVLADTLEGRSVGTTMQV